MIQREFSPTPPRSALEQSAKEEAHPKVDCEECLKRIPADMKARDDVEEYIRHFCGRDCFEIWQARQSNDASR